MKDAVAFPGLVACCLWWGYAQETGRRGQMCVAFTGVLVFMAWMYL